MGKQSIMVDLDDPKTEQIAEVLSNKSCKAIVSALSEREMNATELASELELPLNTIGYNLQKLVDAGLVEKSRNFFWSIKGKKIVSYRVANKKIVIFPRTGIKGVIPAILIAGIIAVLIKILGAGSFAGRNIKSEFADSGGMLQSASSIESSGIKVYSYFGSTPNAWIWFLAGALIAIAIFLLWNWRKK
jgi:DNA-binding transcriptional ArsR family regulator